MAGGAVLPGARVLRGGDDTPVDLVDIAEVAEQVEEEVDAPVVEVGEVDTGSEHPHARVARMLRHPAAYHPDLDGRVEQDQVDAALGRGERRLVLGVEMARVAQLEDARPPAPHSRSSPRRS